MMRSLYAGVAGLRTHQTKMDVLGNNIANVNTTSFKSQSITFSDLMYQTTQAASGATQTKGGTNARQIGLGAKSGAINTAIESQGATQTTNNPFDIMITGKAFFVVNNGKDQLYTRDGSFFVDGAGNLAMQSNGYFVMGWNAKEDAETGEISVDKNGELSSLQIMSADNSTYSPASTTSALVSGNIDDHDSNVVSDDGKTITLEIYDNKGYLYTAKFNIKDTGEDHLFSAELTDIIDSNGNKLTTAQMEGISFGNQQSQEGYKKIQDGYYLEGITTDPTTGVEVSTIYQQSGQTAFENVPGSGDAITTLSDIENFLSRVYPDASTKRYANINSFNIDTDALNVNFDYTDYASSISSETYKSFVLDNKDSYFYYNNDTATGDPSQLGFGYLAPSIEGGKLSSLNTDMLKNLFGISETGTYANVMNDVSNYKYEFDEDTYELTLVASKVPEDTDDPKTIKGLKTIYDKYFVEKTGSGKTISQIADEIATEYNTAGDPTSGLKYPKGAYYIYSDVTEELLVYGGSTKVVGKTESVTVDTSSKLYEKMLDNATNGNWTVSYSSLSDEAKDQLETLMGISKADLAAAGTMTIKYDTTNKSVDITVNTGTTSITKNKPKTNDELYTEISNSLVIDYKTAGTLKSELKKLITNSEADLDTAKFYYNFEQLTGTVGAKVTVTYDVNELDLTTDPLYTFNKYRSNAEALKDNNYDYGTPTVVFRDMATKKTGYCLIDAEPEGFSLDEISDNILSVVYGVTKADIKSMNINTEYPSSDFRYDDFSKLSDEEFTVKFINGGKITVTHKQDDAVPISEDYIAELNDDGTVTYTTAHDVIAFPNDPDGKVKTFPVEGYISDILSTADTMTKGLLEKAYGITDADARAYGSEGYYVIDEDKGIKLYTSKADLSRANKTIQLEFDAASGRIIAANGNETDKIVNMKFDQTIEGLEAFGFQETPGVERENGTIEIDFSTVTNYNTNGSSTIKAIKGDKSSLNTGRAVGEMNGITVSTDGTIYATYSNGQTKLLGQIASAEFANASGLSKEGDNLYASTLNSGEATIQDITTDGGYMNTGVLEMSNVDLSKEFTEMITTQRGFQANSRIITVSDTLLEELTNLKR